MIKNIKLSSFRCFDRVNCDFSDSINFFYGANGSGKTSILESIFLCGNAKSFKTSKSDSLIKSGCDAFNVEATLSGSNRVISIAKSLKNRIKVKVNNSKASAKQLMECLPIISLDSKMFFLATNSPEYRRRVLDRTLFLLSKDFQSSWFSYYKSLRQRNACLRDGSFQQAKSHNPLIIKYGDRVNNIRLMFTKNVYTTFKSLVKTNNESPFFNSLNKLDIKLFNGYKSFNNSFDLDQYFEHDCSRRTTTNGPHKADIILSLGDVAVSEIFSRGEEKIFSIVFGLALAKALIENDQPCITLIDDISSEIDSERLSNLIKIIEVFDGQLFFSNISDVFNSTIEHDNLIKKFHMEQFN